MANYTAYINKETLAFLLAQKKVSVDYLVKKIGENDGRKEQIEQWIDIKDKITLPTINQAKTIAKALHIPFASLYANVENIKPHIHKIPDVKNRRIMDAVTADESLINLAIIDILNARDFYVETEALLERIIPVFNVMFNDIQEDKTIWASKIREVFEISLERQYKCENKRQFYHYLKERIEDKGVFVQEFSGVDAEVLRAIAIQGAKNKMPIIGINEKDRPPAKSFSLIHELVHIIKGTSSLCNAMFETTSTQQQEEIFCNGVAGELLVPQTAMDTIIKNSNYNLNDLLDIGKISNKFCVSREVIIRRFRDLDKITQEDYDTMKTLLENEIKDKKEADKIKRANGQATGFNPNAPLHKAIDNNSVALSKAIYIGYCEDVFTKYDVSKILSLKIKHIEKYLGEVAKWNN